MKRKKSKSKVAAGNKARVSVRRVPRSAARVPNAAMPAAGDGQMSFPCVPVRCTLNGEPLEAMVPAGATLLEFLRYHLRLTGTKEGCGEGECGACTVLLDGRPANSCLTMAAQVDGREVVTIEGIARRAQQQGIAKAGELHPVQQAFIDTGGVQCGFCIPGMIISAVALLEKNPAADRNEIKAGLSGNLCRCTGYEKIFQAVEKAGKIIQNAAGRRQR